MRKPRHKHVGLPGQPCRRVTERDGVLVLCRADKNQHLPRVKEAS